MSDVMFKRRLTNYLISYLKNGKVYMPLSAYPFSERFAWIEDKYGVSWQLSLEKS
jgi:predicted 3-demethylubiquinone-9 3-methyltransferase (glyoxalase superfamily)